MHRMLAGLLSLVLAVTLVGVAATDGVAVAAKEPNPCAKHGKGTEQRKDCDRRRAGCTRHRKGSKRRRDCVRRTTGCARYKQGSKRRRDCVRKRRPKPGKPGTPAPPKSPDLTPIDYSKVEGVSQVRFRAAEIERVPVMLPMHDGTRVSLEIVKPKGETNLPVILEASPYHGTLADRDGTRILPLPLGTDKRPIGLTGYFAPRGYAVAMMDLRGTGRSEGCLDHLGPDDQRDLGTTIEWLATQPWSNGRIGMTGHSYVGSTPQAATKLNPKGLVTTVPSAGLAAMYDHQFQRGVAWNFQYAGPVLAYPLLATQADLPPGATSPLGGGTGDNFGRGRAQDFGCQAGNTALNNGAGNVTGQETAWHKQRDSSREAIAWKGHVFLVHGVNDDAARISAADWFNKRGLPAGDKLWLGQWDHGSECCPNRRGMQWTHALHAWFDRQLALRDVDTGPPVEVFLNDGPTTAAAVPGRKEILGGDAWPGTPRAVTFGTGEGKLLEGRAGERSTMGYVADPSGFAGEETGNATMVAEPEAGDRLLIGLPRLRLVASVAGGRTDLIAKVLDRSPRGEERRISLCAMTPLLRGALDSPMPIVPGEVMELEPSCWPVAHRLRKGHKLVLRVASSDGEFVPLGASGAVSVHVGPLATALSLPVIDGARLTADVFPVGPKPRARAGD